MTSELFGNSAQQSEAIPAAASPLATNDVSEPIPEARTKKVTVMQASRELVEDALDTLLRPRLQPTRRRPGATLRNRR